MKRAQKNGAVTKEKFYFRTNVNTSSTPDCCNDLFDDVATNDNNSGLLLVIYIGTGFQKNLESWKTMEFEKLKKKN